MLLWCCKPHSSSPPHQLHTQLRSVRSKTWCPILETAVSELKCASDWDTPTLLSSFYATNFLIETCRHAGMLMCFNRAYLVLGTASAIWKGSVSANVVILDLLCITHTMKPQYWEYINWAARFWSTPSRNGFGVTQVRAIRRYICHAWSRWQHSYHY